jgi:hypothetical protein
VSWTKSGIPPTPPYHPKRAKPQFPFAAALRRVRGCTLVVIRARIVCHFSEIRLHTGAHHTTPNPAPNFSRGSPSHRSRLPDGWLALNVRPKRRLEVSLDRNGAVK